MIKNVLTSILIVGVSFFMFSCDNNDEEPVKDSIFQNGVFVVNEGNFTDSDGSLSYYSYDSAQVANKVFESANTRPLAAVFQSMSLYLEMGFLVDQSGRLEIVNSNNMVSIKTINADLDIPRYFAGYSIKGFLTDWGPYDENYSNTESKIKVIDMETLEITSEFDTPSRPEGIVALKNMIYVANSATNLVSIYDPADNSAAGTIEVNNGPTSFVIDKDDNLWVISTGAYIAGGALQKINTDVNEVTKTVDLSTISPNGRIAINSTKDIVFFMGEQWAPDFSYTENTVYKANIFLPNSYESIISEENLYGLGIHPQKDEVYVADAVAFQGNGKVYVYDFSGNKINEFGAGRGTRDFVFVTK